MRRVILFSMVAMLAGFAIGHFASNDRRQPPLWDVPIEIYCTDVTENDRLHLVLQPIRVEQNGVNKQVSQPAVGSSYVVAMPDGTRIYATKR